MTINEVKKNAILTISGKVHLQIFNVKLTRTETYL